MASHVERRPLGDRVVPEVLLRVSPARQASYFMSLSLKNRDSHFSWEKEKVYLICLG